MKTWKRAEKRIAKVIQGERTSHQHLGLRSCDIQTERYAVEVKSRKSLPLWFIEAMKQAERNTPQGKIAVLILHKDGWRYDTDDLVLMRIGDWKELVGNVTN